jgi:pyroglutamyl-peptidase
MFSSAPALRGPEGITLIGADTLDCAFAIKLIEIFALPPVMCGTAKLRKEGLTMSEIALVTGFEGYGGRARNPAGEIAKALDGAQIAGLKITGRTLPVSYTKLRSTLPSLLDATRPRVVISLGLWPGESMIRLERIAINVNDFEIPDNEGVYLTDLLISSNGVAAILATLPIRKIEAALLANGIPARLSATAGTFLCNATLYTTLSHAQTMPKPPLTGFIHVPYLPEQVAQWLKSVRGDRTLELHQRSDTSSMELATMKRAVEIAIGTSAAALQ